jgi:hypothetical protein
VVLDVSKALCSIKVSGSAHPIAECHIPEDLNPQLHCCENLKSFTLQYVACIFIQIEAHADILSELNNFGYCAAVKQTF